MSREIEFRAWHLGVKEMYDWETIISAKGSSTLLWLDCQKCNNETNDKNGYKVKNILMQYTGLKDKNGIKIFEGDLLRSPAKNSYEETTFNCFEVFYHDNECIGGINIGFCINRMHPQGHSGGGHGYRFTPESIRTHSLMVIGNIYENPELLGEGK